jgi:hypothetical protein
MKSTPILMKPEMIRAYKAGLNCMTRRVIKPQLTEWVKKITSYGNQSMWPYWNEDGLELYIMRLNHYPADLKCPYGTSGDSLWFKEAWATSKEYDAYSPSDLLRFASEAGYKNCPAGDVWYLLDNEYRQFGDNKTERGRKRSSIYMPKRFARFNPLITEIRVERLQDISAWDAVDEGVHELFLPEHPLHTLVYSKYGKWTGSKKLDADGPYANAIDAFAVLWDSTNAVPKPVVFKKEIVHYVSYPWEDIRDIREYKGLPWYVIGNPWVWVVKFERYNGD